MHLCDVRIKGHEDFSDVSHEYPEWREMAAPGHNAYCDVIVENYCDVALA